ncbi:transcription antitermination protein NusG, partial [mine drainage metagenome]
KPDRMASKEVEKLIADAEKPEAGPAVKVEFLKGDAVKVREGPFENFEGVVDEIFPDKGYGSRDCNHFRSRYTVGAGILAVGKGAIDSVEWAFLRGNAWEHSGAIMKVL